MRGLSFSAKSVLPWIVLAVCSTPALGQLLSAPVATNADFAVPVAAPLPASDASISAPLPDHPMPVVSAGPAGVPVVQACQDGVCADADLAHLAAGANSTFAGSILGRPVAASDYVGVNGSAQSVNAGLEAASAAQAAVVKAHFDSVAGLVIHYMVNVI
ncbi:MAG: hypothetical protein ACYDBQ_12735 [Thermoplasmatota archaeon]